MPENDFLVLKIGSSYVPLSRTRIPTAPSGLAAVAASTVQINLTWTDNSHNETGFKVERSLDGATGWAQIGTSGASVASYADMGLLPNTQYFYRVRSTNSAGNSSYTSTANATTSTGTAYYVAMTGNNSNPGTIGSPFLTLAKGVSVLTPGDILYVRTGTYAEALIDTIPSGTSWSVPVTVSAYASEVVTIQPASGTFVLHFGQGTVSRHYIQVINVILDAVNLSSVSSAAVKITDDGTHVADHIRLQGCTVKNVPAGLANTAPQGIICTVNPGAGLYANANEFISCVISNIGGVSGPGNDTQGFYIQSSNNLLDGCDISGCSSYGMQIYHETSTNNGTDASNNIVRNCKFHGNAIATGSGSGEVLIGMGVNNVFHDNLVYGGLGGVLVKYAANATQVLNNTITGNTNVNFGGLRIAASAAGFSAPANTVVKNNVLYNNKNDFTDLGTGTVTDFNAAGTAPTGLTGASDKKNVGPIFVKGWVTPPDLRLRSFSPILNAGQTQSAAATDIAGVTRSVGGACNIGAYEGSVVVAAATYYISPAGSDSAAGDIGTPWATFAFAAGNLYGGDTLSVRGNGGVYNQRIDSSQPWTSGTAWTAGNFVLIAGYPSDTQPVLQSTASGASACINLFKQKYLEFRDITVDGVNRPTAGAVGIKVQSDTTNGTVSQYIRLRRVTIINTPDAGIYLTDDNTVSPNLHADHCEILGCTIHDCGLNPSGSNNHGISIESNDNVVGRDPVNSVNTLIHDITGFGIFVSKTSTTSGAGLDASRNSISDCKVYTTGTTSVDGACIEIANGDSNACTNNICYDGINGIRVTGTSDGLHNATATKVYNNTIDACTRTGSGAPSGVDGLRIGFATNTDAKNNIASNSGTSDYVNTGTSTTSDYNFTKDATAIGAHSIRSTDPLYTNAGTHDYHLQNSSTAKAAGTSTAPTVTDDYDGVARPDAGAYSIGAFER